MDPLKYEKMCSEMKELKKLVLVLVVEGKGKEDAQTTEEKKTAEKIMLPKSSNPPFVLQTETNFDVWKSTL